MGQTITIGCATVEMQDAARILAGYTASEGSTTSSRPYAYPAYDRMDPGSDPTHLTDGDLLAPQLLNVQVKLVAFYALQRVRPRLELALGDARLGVPLVEHDDTMIEETVRPLYAPLDDADLHGVQGTTLSKVLHRKRPLSLVLHDERVRQCYLESSGLPRAKERSWGDYMVLLTTAVRDDIRRQREQFDDLAAGLSEGVALSHVRILDILAWSLGTQENPPRADANT